MARDKIVQINFNLLREKVTDKTRSALSGVKEKVGKTGQKIRGQATEKAQEVLGGALDKGISVLEKAREKVK